ncbi:MAG: hypothetical protein JNK85_22215 [Verrucomicrobiales bacterium]|nr:hypothetical protein [Verrucomicrobiales bacterium]
MSVPSSAPVAAVLPVESAPTPGTGGASGLIVRAEGVGVAARSISGIGAASSTAFPAGPGAGSTSSGVGRVDRRPTTKTSGRRLPGWLELFLLAVFRPGNRRRSTRTVQTEMCFQTVKVARNDLAVSDVEVVVRSPDRRTMSPDCRARVLRLWWDQGTRHLRRWGQNLF